MGNRLHSWGSKDHVEGLGQKIQQVRSYGPKKRGTKGKQHRNWWHKKSNAEKVQIKKEQYDRRMHSMQGTVVDVEDEEEEVPVEEEEEDGAAPADGPERKKPRFDEDNDKNDGQGGGDGTGDGVDANLGPVPLPPGHWVC